MTRKLLLGKILGIDDLFYLSNEYKYPIFIYNLTIRCVLLFPIQIDYVPISMKSNK